MQLPFFIARRYLFAKKSHNVINIISAISSVGMAIGTAALIIILSVYNGFDNIVSASLGNIEPDILVTPSAGKVFVPDDEAFDWAYEQTSVMNMSSVLQENVYIDYDGRSGVARAKGVDYVYEEETPLRDKVIDGDFRLRKGDVRLAVVGSGLAYEMGINPRFVSGIELYFPASDRQFSMANPASALDMVKVWPSGVFSSGTNDDGELIIVSLDVMRGLLGYTEEVSAIELRMKPGTDAKELQRVIRGLEERLGPSFRVSDRFRQNETVYKMMRYEKAAIFLILVFVIIIIAFNIFGSLTMLIIEKKEDIATLRSLGGTDRLIRDIFVLEGWMISLLGLVAGIVAGIGVVMLQQHFGFVKMPGTFAPDAYPVIIKWTDVMLTAASVAAVGYVIALLPLVSGHGISGENKKF